MKTKIVPKPWGREEWIIVTPHYVGKFLVIKKGKRCSLQYHRRKHETFYTMRGRWLLTINGRKKIMRPGMVADIPPKSVHRMEAKHGDTVILEISTPLLTDIVRVNDDYGRCRRTP